MTLQARLRSNGHLAGWAALAALAFAVDLSSDKTMSEAFRDFSRTPVGRPVMIGVWAYLTIHLFGMIPADRDPLTLFLACFRTADRVFESIVLPGETQQSSS